MQKKHEFDINSEKMLAEVRGARVLLEEILLQLPDLAIKAVLGKLRSHLEEAEDRVRKTQDDRWRDYAEVIYEMYHGLDDAAGQYMSERAEGQWITTIQAVPLSEEEERLRNLTLEA